MATSKSVTSKCLVAVLALAGWVSGVQAAATLTIVNGDPAGVGFNDPTVVASLGGNSGTTLGEQRLIAFQAAADKWGATLTSTVPIKILATWEALTCGASSAVLGSAGALEVFRDFAGAPKPGTWYSTALTNKITGVDNASPDTAHIRARFNVNLGRAGCLPGTLFYLGLDNNHGSNIDLVTVLTHEFGHGLGFQPFTNGSTDVQLAGFPSIWDHYLLGSQTGKLWKDMTAAERAASALTGNRLVWSGAIVNAALPGVPQLGTPGLSISGPAAGAATGGLLGRYRVVRPGSRHAAVDRAGDAGCGPDRPSRCDRVGMWPVDSRRRSCCQWTHCARRPGYMRICRQGEECAERRRHRRAGRGQCCGFAAGRPGWG